MHPAILIALFSAGAYVLFKIIESFAPFAINFLAGEYAKPETQGQNEDSVTDEPGQAEEWFDPLLRDLPWNIYHDDQK